MSVQRVNGVNIFAPVQGVQSPNVYSPVQAVQAVPGFFNQQARQQREADFNFISTKCNPNHPVYRGNGVQANVLDLNG